MADELSEVAVQKAVEAGLEQREKKEKEMKEAWQEGFKRGARRAGKWFWFKMANGVLFQAIVMWVLFSILDSVGIQFNLIRWISPPASDVRPTVIVPQTSNPGDRIFP